MSVHVATANRLLDTGDPLYITAAQVHATLALVEQQRAANLLALASFRAEDEHGASFGTMRQEILEFRDEAARILGEDS